MAEETHRTAAEPVEGLDEARLIEDSGASERIGRIAAPVLRDLGYRLVRVKISAAAGATIQIMAERPDGAMSIEDCESVSLALSPVFDVEEPMAQAYRLEISSPGIDRPLVRPSDFRDWTGHAAKIEMQQAIAGRKRFTGRIEGVQGDEVKILERDGGQSIKLDLTRIAEARLVLTDDLIRETLRRAKRQSVAGAAAEDAAD